jgi:AsmA-like C-terminal region
MPTYRSSKLRKGLMIAGIGLVGLVLVLALFLAFLSPLSERWVVKALASHYNADVQLQGFQVSLFPSISVTGSGLVLRPKRQPGAPPVASVRRFSMEASWLGLLRHPVHVSNVRLDGLTIDILPRKQEEEQPAAHKKRRKHRLPPFYFQNVAADGTVLNIFSSKPQKPPRVFAISKLRLQSIAVGKAMFFQATLTNPKPIGQIQTTGKFGPWRPDDPGRTPVSGSYDFQNADLSTIRGLTGILSSRGEFNGFLNFIEVHGETDTPEFGLGISNNRIELKTRFTVVVDGVNGDTLLRPVWAQLGNSLIIANGGVLRATGVEGRVISLVVSADHARLADILRVAVKSSRPPILGEIDIQSQFDLPPGQQAIASRLKLNGHFVVQSAHFTDPGVEEKMTHLSERAQGRPRQEDGEPAVVDLRGNFTLSNGLMSFSNLSFGVQGAAVNLHGTYGLLNENLDFQGNFQMKAKISQTTTGIKSFLLRAIDPLFKGKGAGTVIPITIKGTREHPSFGIQVGKVLKRLK